MPTLCWEILDTGIWFLVVNTACSHLDFGECLTWFESHISASQRLLGFAVTFDTDYKVSFLLPQLQSGIMKLCKLWLEWVQLFIVMKGSNSNSQSLTGCFSSPLFSMFFFFFHFKIPTTRQFPLSVLFLLIVYYHDNKKPISSVPLMAYCWLCEEKCHDMYCNHICFDILHMYRSQKNRITWQWSFTVFFICQLILSDTGNSSNLNCCQQYLNLTHTGKSKQCVA